MGKKKKKKGKKVGKKRNGPSDYDSAINGTENEVEDIFQATGLQESKKRSIFNTIDHNDFKEHTVDRMDQVDYLQEQQDKKKSMRKGVKIERQPEQLDAINEEQNDRSVSQFYENSKLVGQEEGYVHT
mmetsp:Transcript_22957/g.17394  ORF Transcript_22957/g.17394 Transcript_22957/m.17394 type:complete len:128 (+) Transcript_22957:84-467(+)